MATAATIKRKHFENAFHDYAANNDESANDLIGRCKLNEKLAIKWPKFKAKIEGNIKGNEKDLSVYTGTAGIALVYLRKAHDDEKLLHDAKHFAQVNRSPSRRRLTFLCGDAGSLAIRACICFQLGETQEANSLLKSLQSLKSDAINYKADIPNELLYGRAGYLFALAYVNKHISPPPIEENVIKQVADAIIKSGLRMAKELQSKSPLMYQWHDSYYLGAAHGLSGILYLLLQIHDILDAEQLNNQIRPTIDYLASLRFDSGNYPSSLGSQSGDKYVQWCHGAPGFLFMFAEAFKIQVFNDGKYLQLALEAGDVVWERGLVRKGFSICHGVSGNAYCFLKLYQTTLDLKHLYRAVKFTEWCVDYKSQHEEHAPDRPLSLFEGIAGPMYLLIDIQTPLEAKFPGFTL